MFSWEKIFGSYLTEHLDQRIKKKKTLVPIDRFMVDKWFFDFFVLSVKICECALEKFRYNIGAWEKFNDKILLKAQNRFSIHTLNYLF